jgi:hypothetical protein
MTQQAPKANGSKPGQFCKPEATAKLKTTPLPNQDEIARMLKAQARNKARGDRLTAKVEKMHVGPHHADTRGWIIRLCDAFGTSSDDFAIIQLNALMNALKPREGDIDSETVNAVLAAVDGVRPKDEIEGMLATQMAVTHLLAMGLVGVTNHANMISHIDSVGNLAVKLLRTFTMQVEALTKLRRGGEQTVRVEHVHVYPGGQAIVGAVTQEGQPRGGVSDEKSKRAHAADDPRAVAFAPGSPMPCADASRHPVPEPSGEGQRAMPDARRREGIGRPKGQAQR